MGRLGFVGDGGDDDFAGYYRERSGSGYPRSLVKRVETDKQKQLLPGDKIGEIQVDCGWCRDGMHEGVRLRRIKPGDELSWECRRRDCFSNQLSDSGMSVVTLGWEARLDNKVPPKRGFGVVRCRGKV